jgi:hypothetical protein
VPPDGRVQSWYFRDDSRVDAGWDLMILENDEQFSRRVWQRTRCSLPPSIARGSFEDFQMDAAFCAGVGWVVQV